ncbi:hypothetical protein [Hyperthermus butylicus]|uniref:Uncharacterized protein n=1 Tax=Hyperthermus butylicus (strain DSM 5456 / JCM 9403 / PLM1-5) TaxID=415426 RepID=A2BIZ0_HYPBU|nr:hypothetical protein [Hyperthermus butylicus]ABM79951.1 hypothetical protein Hbut_0075 [Hyperthermus butylicus DSM 5456]
MEKLKPVFNGKPLMCPEHGCYIVSSSNAYPYMVVLILAAPDGKPELLFKRHYLVAGYNIELPINRTHVLLLEDVKPYPETVQLLLSLPDYKLFHRGIEDYLSFAAVAAVLAASAYAARRLRRR